MRCKITSLHWITKRMALKKFPPGGGEKGGNRMEKNSYLCINNKRSCYYDKKDKKAKENKDTS